MVVGPARSPSVTRTRTTPDVSLSAALGVTVPPPLLVVIVTGCPTNAAPVVSRTSSTNACGSVEPTVPCSSAPPVNCVRRSDITGRGGAGGGGGGGGAARADVSVTATTGDGAGALGRAGAGATGRGGDGGGAGARRARRHGPVAAAAAAAAPA